MAKETNENVILNGLINTLNANAEDRSKKSIRCFALRCDMGNGWINLNPISDDISLLKNLYETYRNNPSVVELKADLYVSKNSSEPKQTVVIIKNEPKKLVPVQTLGGLNEKDIEERINKDFRIKELEKDNKSLTEIIDDLNETISEKNTEINNLNNQLTELEQSIKNKDFDWYFDKFQKFAPMLGILAKSSDPAIQSLGKIAEKITPQKSETNKKNSADPIIERIVDHLECFDTYQKGMILGFVEGLYDVPDNFDVIHQLLKKGFSQAPEIEIKINDESKQNNVDLQNAIDILINHLEISDVQLLAEIAKTNPDAMNMVRSFYGKK